MGYKVGNPVLKCDRKDHFGKKDKRSGNATGILKEALPDEETGLRICKDPDFDPSKTKDNLYFYFNEEKQGFEISEGPIYSNKMIDYWNEMADSYKVKDKNGKEKKLRSDAVIGFAGVCKPEKAFMNTLDKSEQIKFFSDAIDVLNEVYAKKGMAIDYATIHFDEGVPHMHYGGHDDKFTLGKKIGLPLYAELNKGSFPDMMRSRGWELDNLYGFQEEIDGKTDEEVEEIKKKKKETRSGGKSSLEYKVQKEVEKRLAEYRAELADGYSVVDSIRGKIQAVVDKLDQEIAEKEAKEKAEKEAKIKAEQQDMAKAKADKLNRDSYEIETGKQYDPRKALDEEMAKGWDDLNYIDNSPSYG